MGSPSSLDSPRALELEVDAPGQRLDALLAQGLGVSRAEARRLLARGAVSLDGRTLGANAKGRRPGAGARIRVAPFTARAQLRVEPRRDPLLQVLAQGAGWLVVDKPPGVPVHPLEPGEQGTLLSAVAALRPGIQGVGEGGLRSGVVHRLDVDTSGAVVFADDPAVWERLRAAFRAHRVQKVYRALVLGGLPASGRTEVGLMVARHRPARVAVVDPRRAEAESRVRRARLAWRVIEELPGAGLVEIALETGFLHQVRATLAHLGAPLAGDRIYGPSEEDDGSGAPRHMLHAARLAVDEIAAVSPDPADFTAVLEELRS